MPARGKANGTYQGMNFVTPAKRIALYLRDGLACCYCGTGIEDAVRFTLDHLLPYSQGGTHHADNLITACLKCNSSRGDREYQVFAESVAAYLNHGITAQQIIEHIETTRQRPIDLAQAKEIIARRGGFTAAMQSFK